MKVLACPIFSMRSYKTGKYSILKDGNFQLMMSRLLASDFEMITVSVPNDASDFQEVLARFKSYNNIFFVQAQYGENAAQTRSMFWDKNVHTFPSDVDLVITDITGCSIFPEPVPIIYNFNITKLPELDRPYIDCVFDLDLESISKSLFTTVLNPRQREYILECRPDLEDRVKVYFKCANEALLPKPMPFQMPDATIFWPFRISDKAYKWDQFLKAFDEANLGELGWNVIITDPNQSSRDLPSYVIVLEPTKEQYYQILAGRPIVVMLDEIDTVLHPGTIELFNYGCRVITLKSDLIKHDNQIEDLSQLADKLLNIDYSMIDFSRFVYAEAEISTEYNTSNIQLLLKEH